MDINVLRTKLENLIGREIVYKNYGNNEKMQWIGEMVEKNMKAIQKNYDEDEVSIGNYSPFQYEDLEYPSRGFRKYYGKRLPTWQTLLWEPFLNFKGELDFKEFENSILFINKPKKVGNTYTIAHLASALLLTDQISNALAGAANMQWLTSFFMPSMRHIFPKLVPTAKRSKSSVIAYHASEKMFFINQSEMKVVGLDSQKRRMKGHKAKFAFLDETASIKSYELIYETLMNPILRTRGGIILGGTPDPDSGQWFDEIFNAAIRKEGVYSGLNVHTLKFDIYESGMWTEKRIDEMLMLEYSASRSLYPEASEEYILTQIAQENFNYFIQKAGVAPMAYNFVRNENNIVFPIEALPDISKFTHYTSIDYGESIYDAMSATFWAYDNDATYYLIADWEEYDSKIQSVADNVIGTWSRFGISANNVTHYLDRNSHNKRFKTNDGYMEKLKDRFFQAGLYVQPSSNLAKIERVELLNRMLEDQGGVWHPFWKKWGCPQILIGNNCNKTIESMKKLKLDWSERKKSLVSQFSVLKNDHVMDSILQIVPFFRHIERPTPELSKSHREFIIKSKEDAGFKII